MVTFNKTLLKLKRNKQDDHNITVCEWVFFILTNVCMHVSLCVCMCVCPAGV